MAPKPFALSPAQSVTGPLLYSKTEHAKQITRQLMQVSKQLFDCEPEGLFQFLKEVQDRAEEMGWNKAILQIGNLMMKILPRWTFSLITETSCLNKLFHQKWILSTKRDGLHKTLAALQMPYGIFSCRNQEEGSDLVLSI
jgi:hypothetical protein